ncbi:MAG: homocysteine S-methyltransferase family protein, partial [Ruminiclostridium sp.]|nr:homocysteine S-methyltransferase family protein [Ruminiclostridium sp.]
MNIKELIAEKGFLIFDGGMGTELQARGLKTGEIPELLNFTAPDVIKAIHLDYLNAGADIITANTFGANRYKLCGCEKSVEEIILAGVKNARNAVTKSGRTSFVAQDIGPIGQLLEPTGTLIFEDAYGIFAEQVKAGVKAGADLFIIETMTDLYELKAALLAVKENSSLPVVCSMTYEESGRTFTGCPVEAEVTLCEALRADAVGINCSLGPKELMPIVKRLCEASSLPVIVMPNAGLPDPESGKFTITAEEFSDYAVQMANIGVNIFGGCCGTTPAFIKAVAEKLKGVKPTVRNVKKQSAVCSGTRVCCIDEPRIIGERINPTGKKLFKE